MGASAARMFTGTSTERMRHGTRLRVEDWAKERRCQRDEVSGERMSGRQIVAQQECRQLSIITHDPLQNFSYEFVYRYYRWDTEIPWRIDAGIVDR